MELERCCAFWTVLALIVVVGGEQCVRKSPCRCDYPNYSSVDLTPLVPTKKFISATLGNLTVYSHGCRNAVFTHELKNLSDNFCREGVTMCLFNKTDRSLKRLGGEERSAFVASEDNPEVINIAYQNETITTIVRLVCAPDFNRTSLHIRDVATNQFTLEMFSRSACRFSTATRLSTGTRLIIMFFWFLITYIVGGSCISYFLSGARGTEIIPHIEFWTKLPGLVKDGFTFLSHGCNATAVSTYNEIS